MTATPDTFRPYQRPLGAVLLPQVPTSVGLSPSPEGLSLARVGLSVPRLSSIFDNPILPRGNPSYEMSHNVLLTIADALSSRRWTRSAHNPCSFRWNRTPWSPTSNTRPLRSLNRWQRLLNKINLVLPTSVLSPHGPERRVGHTAHPVGESKFPTWHLNESSFATC